MTNRGSSPLTLRAPARTSAAHALITTAVSHHDRAADVIRVARAPSPAYHPIPGIDPWLKWPAALLFPLLAAVLSERNTPPDIGNLPPDSSITRISWCREAFSSSSADKPSALPEKRDILCSARREQSAPRHVLRYPRTYAVDHPMDLRFTETCADHSTPMGVIFVTGVLARALSTMFCT